MTPARVVADWGRMGQCLLPRTSLDSLMEILRADAQPYLGARTWSGDMTVDRVPRGEAATAQSLTGGSAVAAGKALRELVAMIVGVRARRAGS